MSNHSSQTIRLIEVDYPSASFGTQTLLPGTDFHYRFKVIGEGRIKLIYTDQANQEKSFDGPLLKEGAEGPLSVTVSNSGTSWLPGPKVVPSN